MKKLENHRLGLTIGVFSAALHALWMLAVALVPNWAQKFLDLVFTLHHISPVYVVLEFNIAHAFALIAIAFAASYAFGWLLAFAWNKL